MLSFDHPLTTLLLEKKSKTCAAAVNRPADPGYERSGSRPAWWQVVAGWSENSITASDCRGAPEIFGPGRLMWAVKEAVLARKSGFPCLISVSNFRV